MGSEIRRSHKTGEQSPSLIHKQDGYQLKTGQKVRQQFEEGNSSFLSVILIDNYLADVSKDVSVCSDLAPVHMYYVGMAIS
jgi:hypothetical protein